MKNLLKNWILPLLIVLFGAGIFALLVILKPKAQLTPPKERIVPVEILRLESRAQTVNLKVSGSVEAAKAIALKPEVAGRIAEVSEAFIPGGTFKKGEPILQLNPVDLQATLAQAESTLAQAEYAYQLELGQQEIAQHEWSMMDDQEKASELEKSLTLRKPQLAQVAANLKAAQAAVEKAKLDVQRTTITAPFNAQIVSRTVEQGSQVSTSTELAQIAGSDEYWITATLATENLQWLDIPGTSARISQNGKTVANGEVFALEPALEPSGRLARILIRILDPLSLETPLLLDAYVHAELTGKSIPQVFAIPADARTSGQRGSGW